MNFGEPSSFVSRASLSHASISLLRYFVEVRRKKYRVFHWSLVRVTVRRPPPDSVLCCLAVMVHISFLFS